MPHATVYQAPKSKVDPYNRRRKYRAIGVDHSVFVKALSAWRLVSGVRSCKCVLRRGGRRSELHCELLRRFGRMKTTDCQSQLCILGFGSTNLENRLGGQSHLFLLDVRCQLELCSVRCCAICTFLLVDGLL